MTKNQKQNPTPAEWRRLYQLAEELYTLAPWRWMTDTDLFGVKNPSTGEIGYCCIMGNAGQHFALGIYLGSQGLAVYRAIQSHDVSGVGALLVQRLLMVSFEDRKFIEKEDRAIMRKLSLSFRGRNAWPLFRSYEPAQWPWFITKVEGEFLIVALEQSLNIAVAFQHDPGYLESPKLGKILVRKVNGVGEWHDTWENEDVKELVHEEVISQEPDQNLIRNLQETGEKSSAIYVSRS